jgi:serine-threonine kinase receptor-associated protein
MTGEMNLGEPISSMELAHGGGTLSVTSGSKVHFLDILRYVPLLVRTVRTDI